MTYETRRYDRILPAGAIKNVINLLESLALFPSDWQEIPVERIDASEGISKHLFGDGGEISK
jgi:hypothetical protein